MECEQQLIAEDGLGCGEVGDGGEEIQWEGCGGVDGCSGGGKGEEVGGAGFLDDGGGGGDGTGCAGRADGNDGTEMPVRAGGGFGLGPESGGAEF